MHEKRRRNWGFFSFVGKASIAITDNESKPLPEAKIPEEHKTEYGESG